MITPIFNNNNNNIKKNCRDYCYETAQVAVKNIQLFHGNSAINLEPFNSRITTQYSIKIKFTNYQPETPCACGTAGMWVSAFLFG